MFKNILTRQFRISLICLLLSGLAIGAESVGHKEKLCKLALKGQLSEALISEFYQYALANAKEQIQAPNEFWRWLAKNKEMQRGLLVGLHPDYNPYVIKHLRQLRKDFSSEVEEYPHLALAFSFVYGAAKDKSIRHHWIRWVAKNRDVPSCSESFGYYMNNKAKMLYPLDQLPWPLMLHVANNDVPLSERQWVLNRYAGRSIAKLGRLHTKPPYIKGTHANTLPLILKDGGVCYKQAYFTSGVLKSLGVPSYNIYVPGHIYEGWVVNDRKLKVKIGVPLGYNNGSFFCPQTRTKVRQYEFELLVSAINFSYHRYLKSKIACHVFKILPDDSKKDAIELLKAAIKTNPYVVESWLEYTQVCADGGLPLEAGLDLCDHANGVLSEYPEVSCAILKKLTTVQLKNGEVIGDDQYQQTRNNFKETIKGLRKVKRFDSALNALKTHASYLAKTKGVDAVVDDSLGWFKLKEFKLSDKNRLFKHVHKIALDSKDEKSLEKLLRTEYYRRKLMMNESSEKLYTKYYSCYGQVGNAYVSYLKKTGNKTKASDVSLELNRYNNENFNLGDLRDVIISGGTLGATEEQVSRITPRDQGCHVWRILYYLPKGLNIRVRVKHAAAGKDGAFYFTAWSDKDNNGVPDTNIATSPLMTVKKKDQWSNWEFLSTGKPIFVGIDTKTKISIYYQMGGDLEGYYGLSDRVFYSRVFADSPKEVYSRVT